MKKIIKNILLTALGIMIGLVIAITNVRAEVQQNKYIILTWFGCDFIHSIE